MKSYQIHKTEAEEKTKNQKENAQDTISNFFKPTRG